MTDPLFLAIEGANMLAVRLAQFSAALAPLRPFDAVRVDTLDGPTAERCDAFLKRYENLLMQFQDQVWRQVLEAEDDDPSPMSRRDIAERMDRLGLVLSARHVRDATELRNRLAHAYPMQPAIQGRRIEAALNSAPVLIDAAARAAAWFAARGG